MKTPTSGAVITKSEDFQSQGFSIEVSAQAFRILSSGLYSNKIRAIIRELSCNAWDSHIAAEKESTPFEIQLPSYLSFRFSIRDYGTGLSLEDLMGMYTSYFSSTKTETNAQTGCFGLGSKSPFSYTEKFTVVDYFEGQKHFCNAIINEKGFPELVVLATSTTNEPNGLEISFEVSDSLDFGTFKREAEEVLRPFPPSSFTVRGYPDFDKNISRYCPVLEGKGWRLNSHQKSTLIMGNVEYPVPHNVPGLSLNALRVIRFGADVDFPLGSFEVTPSREMVQWSDFSVKNVNSRLESIYEEVVASLESSLVGCGSRWDAMRRREELRLSYSSFNVSVLSWHGQELTKYIDIKDNDLSICQVEKRFSTRKRAYFAKIATPFNIVPSQIAKIYLADVEDAQSRLSYAITSGHTATPCLLVSVRTNRKYKRAMKALGIRPHNLTLASTLPVPPVTAKKTKRRYKAISKSKLFSLVGNYSRRAKDNWKEISIDFDSPVGQGLYTEIRRWKVTPTPDYSPLVVLQALKYLEVIPQETPLVGVRTSGISKFQASSKWKTLEEFASEATKKLILSDKKLFLAYDLFKGPVSSAFELKETSDFLILYDELKDSLDDSSSLHKVGRVLTLLHSQKDRVIRLFSIAKACPSFEIVCRHFSSRSGYYREESIEAEMENCRYMKKVFNDYPLLRALYLSRSVKTESVVEYIQAIDYYRNRNY